MPLIHKEKSVLSSKKKQRLQAEHLYYAYRTDMFRTAFALLEDKNQSEEAIHISFERILKSGIIVDESDTQKVKAFLKLICRNAAIDILRKNGREIRIYEDIPDRNHSDLTDIIINKENLSRLLDCINNLRPIYRDVMMLKFYHGYENRTVAKTLGITEENVRKRIERGRRELKILLEKEAEKDEV